MSTMKTATNPEAATQALWNIAETNDANRVEPILAEGADIDARNEHGMTALMRAASRGRIRMVRALLEHGADPNLSRNDKFTALMLAAFFGHEEIVKVLVEHGADTGAATRFGTSAKMWASSRTFAEVVNYLNKPITASTLSNEPTVERGRSQVLTDKPPLTIDDRIVNLAAPPAELEKPVLRESGVVVQDKSTKLARPVNPPNELPEVQETVEDFAQRPMFMPVLQPTNWRIVVYSLATLLLVVALIAGLTWQGQRSLSEMGSQTHPVSVDKPQAQTTLNAQVGRSSQVNDVNNNYKTPETVTPENKSQLIPVARSAISNSDSRAFSMRDLSKDKQSEEPSPVANANVSGPIAAEVSEEVRDRDLSSTAAVEAPPTKNEPVVTPVSRVSTVKSGPAPLSSQVISRSKSSPPQGRPIQWP
jgi:hypothetical protein